MPVWHALTKQARDAGQLVVLGVIQEQHPDRCRLFAQWKGLDWPILHDPINLLKARAVPIFVAIDEAGIVVDSNLPASQLADFLARPASRPSEALSAVRQSAQSLDVRARQTNAAEDWMAAGDQRILWGETDQVTLAIQRYAKAVELAPGRGDAQFRMGVALRMRYDSPAALQEDFQTAVDAWDRALDVDPNHYIYRRRIQQFGPRLIKPYPFYDWIHQARKEIAARGEEPTQLIVEPVGAEIAHPSKSVQTKATTDQPPDPQGRVRRDLENLIDAAATVVPGTIKPGEAVRVHLKLQPNRGAHWNNEAEPMRIWIEVPDGWQVERPMLEAPQPREAESSEQRCLDFELRSPEDTSVDTIKAYALCYICEEAGGQCLYRRKDLRIQIRFRR